MQYQNIYNLFRDRTDTFRVDPTGQESNVFFVREREGWRGVSWSRFDEDTVAFASALIVAGLSAGASVCILMGNVPEWPVADIGTIIAGGVGVGLYPTSSAEQCKYIINHSDAEFVVVDTSVQLAKVLSIRKYLPRLKGIISLDAEAAASAENVNSYANFLQKGREYSGAASSTIRDRGGEARPDDTAIIVYTSGTTGQPKGACLSHRYVINSVESLRETIPIYSTDTCFSYLPYCHVAERISGLYNRLYAGTPAYFVDDLSMLGQYMQEVRPTVFASLPRFFEKIHARALADLDASSAAERESFQMALSIGRQIVSLRQDRVPIPVVLQTEYERVALPELSRVKQYFGGNLRLATSGGAPLPKEVAEFFAAANIPILQAYGLTENICVAFNRADDYRFGTVGRAMPRCEIVVAEDKEIMVRSLMMFSGYYKQPGETAEVMRDGWLRTGDLGELDADGFLTITGRKKELIVTSTGKNISPSLLENMIKEHHLISHALVFGEGKSYLVALITLNQSEAEAFAGRHGIHYRQFDELVSHPAVLSEIEMVMERVNRRVSSTEAIRRFLVLDRDFQIETEEITPTMKLKRDVVTKRYREAIEELYSADKPTEVSY